MLNTPPVNPPCDDPPRDAPCEDPAHNAPPVDPPRDNPPCDNPPHNAPLVDPPHNGPPHDTPPVNPPCDNPPRDDPSHDDPPHNALPVDPPHDGPPCDDPPRPAPPVNRLCENPPCTTPPVDHPCDDPPRDAPRDDSPHDTAPINPPHDDSPQDATSDNKDDLLNGFDRLDELDGLDNVLDGLLSFKDEEEENDTQDGEITPIDPTSARDLGTHASRHPDKPGQPASKPKDKGKKSTAEKATSALMQEQLKARRKGLKEAVQRLHDQVKEQADELADTFKLSKAEVHGVIMSATKMKKPKAYHEFDAKVWRCCQQHNEGKPKGERINMIQGRAMVRDEPEGTWSQEELDQLKIDWMTAQALKKTGTHKTNAEAVKDATVTGDRIFEKLLLLERRTRFLPDILRMDAASFTNKFSGWAHFDTDTEEAKLAKGPGKKNFVTTTLREKLREITGKPTLSIEYVRYDEIMRAKEGVKLVGWPDMPMMAPSKMSVGGSAAIDTLYERLKAGTCYWRRVNPEKRKSTKGKGKDVEDESDAEETEEEDEAPPPKKKKKARAAREDSDEEEAPPTKKGQGKEEEVAEAEKQEGDAPPKKKAKKRAVQAPPGRSASIVPSNADKSDDDNAHADPTNCPSTSASPSAAAASTSKSASDARWDKIRVSDDVVRLSQEAAEKMKAMPKNLKEIEEEDYEGSSGSG
ncbi:hypothetical protein B0H17DRAFT_1203462 [Mycena rosella]|uniref:Uncharacterized protein n=1 Tax=Mycena rosella TaxID=1033263 RepID=A0AAD7GEV7_MYCRO|nr:hypothetical protein B0H17DRAFT_1203462 [Mycena rosella]